ncbi:MAG: hypothetical protein AMJ70_03820 [Dehalococcoidia bacterium SG8_51_3]|nr:MAG: hypothetical protein AMJ70_03820 [Dehalococcoidia bacterium SG8_51_3]
MTIKDQYSTITEAALYLGVTRQSISRWIREGKLVPEAIGRVKLIQNSNLHRFKYELLGKEVKEFVSYLIFTLLNRTKRGNIMAIRDLGENSIQSEYHLWSGRQLEILWENSKKSILTTWDQMKAGPSEDDEDVIIDESKTFYKIEDV